jgi:hypothetical protein
MENKQLTPEEILHKHLLRDTVTGYQWMHILSAMNEQTAALQARVNQLSQYVAEQEQSWEDRENQAILLQAELSDAQARVVELDGDKEQLHRLPSFVAKGNIPLFEAWWNETVVLNKIKDAYDG